MYNYKEYKRMKEGEIPTCGECKYFTSSKERCKLFTSKHVEEYYDACIKFDSHYEG